MVHLYPSTKDYIAFSAVPRRRRAGGLTLLELGIVIMLVGFLSLLLVDQQTRILQDRASRARQDQVVAHATAILETALNYNEDVGHWPTGPPETVAALRTGLLAGYLPGDISNPYSPRPGLSEDFTLEAQPTMLPTNRFMELSFQVWGESDARYIAGLLPFGTSMQVGTSEVYDITTQVIVPERARYLHRDGGNTAEHLIFETDLSTITQDRTMANGVQGIEGVDRITFDTSTVARTDANPNTIRGADRVIHQADETGNLTGLELESNEASLLVRAGAIMSHRARFDVDGTQGRLRLTREIAGGLIPLQEGVAIGFQNIEVPAGGDIRVDGSRGLHERLCDLQDQLDGETFLGGPYTKDSACP